MKTLKLSQLVLLLAVTFPITAYSQDNKALSTTSFSISDTLFSKPYIDKDEWRNKPVRHRYIHGGFKGSETRFSFYFPSKKQYQGHFFQYITPFPDNENLAQNASDDLNMIAFSASSGAYFIETNGGGGGIGNPMGGDPTIGAYRANAAAAQFSRMVAKQIYETTKRPYGYSFGGSGGAYRTVGGLENTQGVWDGVVPMVMGSPVAIPNVFTVRMYAMSVLHDKFSQIVDALEPGGSGDMYTGLNPEQKSVLQEVTKMGFPPQSWYAHQNMGIHGFIVLYQTIVMIDNKYFTEDFWKKPGYLGYNPPESLLKNRIRKPSQIKSAINTDEGIKQYLIAPLSEKDRGTADLAWKSIGGAVGSMPVAFELSDNLPDKYFLGGDLIIKSGKAAGKTLFITKIAANKVVLGPNDQKILLQIQPGDSVAVDNSNFLAIQTYHRHQDPGKDYRVWDQFRDANGKSLYPQRPMQLGPIFTQGASGVLPTGKFKGKMILLESLWDREAFPWQADWYRTKVKENLGDSLDQHFRLWYTDHAIHGERTDRGDSTHTVSYSGVLQQALRDLSAWVEKGMAPPASTNYEIKDGQVIVPATAAARKGIQPVVMLKANGGKKTVVKKGQNVVFTASIGLPPHTGRIESAEWDFEGTGAFPASQKKLIGPNSGYHIVVTNKYAFTKPGTYFCIVRVTSQRRGDANSVYAKVQNIDRVRVVVK
ncbi:hypothetical protein DIU31_010665 [Mucilaginibacter rubeus]|uniref:PKD domain-containing protein n=1 Tax=Mucilaginibacter rubeus TaxID=2027860 RepID=A0AAE6JER2_9SPHI|nr:MULTISPECIES: hypothetical protein [Mucilaginibacter]QEM03953.1 hypothetical protein DIU31_010665 [Mucilaginibacter rubeus]QEM16561.1 hypothetical protein DIU38_010765 [Mucilaginibacter gossypii]QTE40668.1 hypothetical protein J3L19_16980 [Mucilaginibacter rubeus]QTE47270.1 hypothetical protein J3L21_16955 [Mucilaginibacter rubeus]QTE58663.1 hypothetical protein J3L23_08630 [Mucilaginibacter rubeus]